tara:strand:- start:247 stop:612 length:366 start_codon:yes stop_codon:yes gene_type:complete
MVKFLLRSTHLANFVRLESTLLVALNVARAIPLKIFTPTKSGLDRRIAYCVYQAIFVKRVTLVLLTMPELVNSAHQDTLMMAYLPNVLNVGLHPCQTQTKQVVKRVLLVNKRTAFFARIAQ